MTEGVYYFIGPVRTHFTEWLGCATKFCKWHKKNTQVCHIRPESMVYPVGNGLYECIECHYLRENKDQGIFWTIRDKYAKSHVSLLSEAEVKQLQHHLNSIREGYEMVKDKLEQVKAKPKEDSEEDEDEEHSQMPLWMR
jgi:hypothetical protein